MGLELLLIVAFALIVILIVALLVALLGRRRLGGFSEASVFESISRRLEQIEQLSKGVEDLSRIFLIPHARGGIGELLLEELLKSWLPRSAYETQYSFKNGARVDAIVRIRPYIIPIDAKFPLESIRRSMNGASSGSELPGEVRQSFLRHVEDISGKYIQPEEGTMQFALMYIPSERVYYQVFADSDGTLTEEALKRGVVPVSPSTLFLYIQTVAYGLRGFAFPEEQRELLRSIQQLRGDLVQFVKSYSLAGTHLKNLQKAFDESYTRLAKVESVVDRLQNNDATKQSRE